MPLPVDWIVFGDDWGRHPSTTQHLVRALPAGDRVIWVDSLGMRAPRLRWADVRRVFDRLRPAPPRLTTGRPGWWRHVRPRLLPWHGRPGARAFNRERLRTHLGPLCRRLGPLRVLAANPVAAWYLDALRPASVAYLRLDDYPALPGVDAQLARAAETQMLDRADVVFATARALCPPGARYLPQGVDATHFGQTPLAPPRSKVVGFFGLFAEWLDLPFIEAVVDAAPSWTFEFLGPRRVVPTGLMARPNVRFRPAVPYAELPGAIAHWQAAWLPFRADDLGTTINPLKAREYLAAGLPAGTRGLPETRGLLGMTDLPTVDSALAWLIEAEADTAAARCERRVAMQTESWAHRATTLRGALV